MPLPIGLRPRSGHRRGHVAPRGRLDEHDPGQHHRDPDAPDAGRGPGRQRPRPARRRTPPRSATRTTPAGCPGCVRTGCRSGTRRPCRRPRAAPAGPAGTARRSASTTSPVSHVHRCQPDESRRRRVRARRPRCPPRRSRPAAGRRRRSRTARSRKPGRPPRTPPRPDRRRRCRRADADIEHQRQPHGRQRGTEQRPAGRSYAPARPQPAHHQQRGGVLDQQSHGHVEPLDGAEEADLHAGDGEHAVRQQVSGRGRRRPPAARGRPCKRHQQRGAAGDPGQGDGAR